MNSHSLLDSNFVDKSAPPLIDSNAQFLIYFQKFLHQYIFFDDTMKFDVDLNSGKTQNVNFDDTKK